MGGWEDGRMGGWAVLTDAQASVGEVAFFIKPGGEERITFGLLAAHHELAQGERFFVILHFWILGQFFFGHVDEQGPGGVGDGFADLADVGFGGGGGDGRAIGVTSQGFFLTEGGQIAWGGGQAGLGDGFGEWFTGGESGLQFFPAGFQGFLEFLLLFFGFEGGGNFLLSGFEFQCLG